MNYDEEICPLRNAGARDLRARPPRRLRLRDDGQGHAGWQFLGVSPERERPAGRFSSSSSAEKKEQKLTIKVYYPDEQGMKLIADKRTITLDQQEKYTAAMESLLEGTTEKGQTNIIPKQTKLRSVKVANGTATVDFTGDLRKDFVGGSTGETMLVGSIVDTLTEFPEVKKVQILIDGKKVESLGGHMDLSQPLTRMTDLLK